MRRVCRLAAPQPDGATLGAHLERVADGSGIEDERLDVAVPEGAEILWGWFWEIRPVTWSELDAWQRVSGIPLSRWEQGTLRAMDAAVAEIEQETLKERTHGRSRKTANPN